MEEHYCRLEQMYLSAPCNNDFYGETAINISKERAEITCRVLEKYHHSGGSMHGSCYFRMLDDAEYFAVNSIIKDVFVYTVSSNINITRPVSEGIIKSIGEVTFQSRQLYVAQATLYNEENEVIAFGTGNFMKSRFALSDAVGYR